jgi:hypothetical protein
MIIVDELLVVGDQRIVRLPESVHAWYVDQFERRFVNDPARIWWWKTLSVPTTEFSYGESDGLREIEEVATSWGPVVLLITDEQAEPPASLFGLVGDIVGAIRECTNFEFVLARPNLSEWVFDTHENFFSYFSEV